jgi:hypothetical protein
MRLVDLNEGRLELRWTWFPYWIAAGPALHTEIEPLMRDAVIMNGMVPNEESLERIEAFVLRVLERRFKIVGLKEYVAALRYVREA